MLNVGCSFRPAQSGNSFVPFTLCFLLAFALAAPLLEAQTTRPGSSTRSSTTRSGTSGRTGTSSGSRNSSGQRTYRSSTELGDAMITIDPETRSLVIVTDEETHREMTAVIQTLDKPKPQVLIKVVFLEVTYNNTSDIGVEGSYTFNLEGGKPASTGTRTTASTKTVGNQTITSSLVETIGSAASLGRSLTGGTSFGVPAAGAGLVVGAVGDDWSATLRFLSTKGKVEVLSRPSIMARNNQEAVIVIGSEVPFITNSRTDNNGNLINTITYDNVGIILRVTPFITSEGTIEMIVAPEISTLNTSRTVPIGNDVEAPTIDKRSAETVVVTPNGKSVVIGGLMETQRIDVVQKVPWLGDIPILGIPFRRTVKSDQKRELMIFLTPTIVNNPRDVDQVNADELGRTELVDRAFTDKDKAKYFDNLPLLPEFDAEPEGRPVARATAVKRTTAPKAQREAERTKEPPPMPEPAAEKPRPAIRGKATPF